MYTVILLINFVMSEGYYCPYSDLGATDTLQLMYDYYESHDNTYWTRMGETGWMSIVDYCKNKGDLSLHSDAGEWKCNDSHLLCFWDGNSCQVNQSRNPDCKELCQSVLNNNGPECLGNCPNGPTSNYLYSTYCEPSLGSNNDKNSTNTHHHNHNHNHNHNNNHKKHNTRCRK